MVLGEVGAEEHASVDSFEQLSPVVVMVVPYPAKNGLSSGVTKTFCPQIWREKVKHQVS
jgi:hypothetical protein